MFNSTILDVAIGMIFVYLLLSLLCSAANEIIELLLKKRAIDLERGIREMLVPGSPSGAADIVRDLYNHPFVNNLFGGRYEDTRIESWIRYIWRTHLPTYIPSRSFALALMDLILPNRPAAAAGAAVPPVQPSGTAGALPADLRPDTVPHPPPSPDTPRNPLENLRNEVASTALLNAAPQARRALMGLIDAAGTDAAKARQNIEDWFNSSMDRVSGWYKRRAQVFLLIIGFFVAIAVNADSIVVAKRLSTDKALRDSLVSAAQEYAKANANTSPSPTPASKATPTPTPTPSGSPPASPTPKPTPTPSGSGPASATPMSTPCEQKACPPGKENTEECKARILQCQCSQEFCGEGKEDTPLCKLKKNQCELEALGLPIGWKLEEWPGLHFWQPVDFVTRWYPPFRLHFFGWLLTALAISLGAPFWFDLLNKFIVVRSTVKPKEKSPEEKSKD